MIKRSRTLVLTLALAAFTTTLAAAPAPHDLRVRLKALNTIGVGIVYPGPVKFEIRIDNLGPVRVSGLYKMIINKYDHTGQRWLKSVFTRDLPLLDPPGGDLSYFTYLVEDTAGDPRTDKGTTFIYRAFIGPGYYTDPVNANNRSDVAVRFLASNASATPLTEPLLHAARIPAGSSIARDQFDAESAR